MLRLTYSLKRAFGKKPEKETRRSAVGTCVDRAGGCSLIEQTGANPARGIAKSGNGYLYLLCAEISGSDNRCMEIAKESVISCLSASESERKPSIGDSLIAAKSSLSGLVQPDRVDLLSYIVAHDTAGYGPISILMEDRCNIEEIEVSSPTSPITIYSTKYGRCHTNLRFCSEAAFRSSINRMIDEADKEIGEGTPIIDAQVADLRVHAQIRPYAISGAAASIRIGGRKEIGLDYLMQNGTANADVLAYLWIAEETKHNIIISGAPASGKTTMLSAMSSFIPCNEKIVTIEEDVNELKGTGIGNTIALYGSRYNSISPREQVINSLRMRPSRIMIGEMRGEEAKDLFMGANIGISFAATMHSNEGGMQILKKLMVKPMCVDTKSLSMLDVAVYMKQTDVSRRVVSDVFEYGWLSRAEISQGEDVCGEDMVRVLCTVRGSELDKASLAESKVLSSYCRMQGISVRQAIKELERRSRLIGSAHSKNGKYGSVEAAIREYSGW